MDKLTLKSCFIFNPNLKSLIAKPSDDEKQDAKLLIYYPNDEELLIKRSNMGIIEGTKQFHHSFNEIRKNEKNKDEFLLTELNSSYYFSQKYEDEYFIAILVEKTNKNFNINENVNYRVTLFKNILNNFYNYFYLFHGTFKENFCPNGKDIRTDQAQYEYLQTIFLDFIGCYFDYIRKFNSGEMFQPLIANAILYSTTKIYPNLLFSILKVNEKFRDIKYMSLIYNGFLIHNEIDVEVMSLLYNMIYNNINGTNYMNKFRYPIFKEKEAKNEIIDNKDKNKVFDLVEILPLNCSPFLKGFIDISKNKDINNFNFNNNYFIGCDLINRKIFIPTIHFYNTKEKMKLMVYNIKDLSIFLFFDENFEFKDNFLFDQLAVFLDVCFNENLPELQKINFEEKNKEIKKEFDFVYYNKQNKSLKLSNSFYAKNSNEIDKNKIPILEKIKELIMSKRIKKSVTKFEGQYFYYFEQFQKSVAIILKENKAIEEVKVKYFNKILKMIDFY